MTCIVAVANAGIVWMGGDSLCTWNSDSCDTLVQPKVSVKNNMILGCAGNLNHCQKILHCWEPPTSDQISGFEYILKIALPSLKSFYEDNDIDLKDETLVLIGYQGRVYIIGTELSVHESVYGYAAIGSGDMVAYGALYVTQNEEPPARIKLALEASERHCSGVRAPFTILSA
jgi:ATP-dependent protease HslVU (ClpYQ) peptidase subunit